MKIQILFFSIGFMVLANLCYASNPNSINVSIICPGTDGPLIKLNNKILGNGDEKVDDQPSMKILFSGFSPANFTGPISTYLSAGATYSPISGQVSCYYIKRNAPDFFVSYVLLNALGGTVVSQTNNSLMISIPCGLA